MVFGNDDLASLQMRFSPEPNGSINVFYSGDVGDDALRAELNRAGRGLWDKEKDAPGPEFTAISAAAEVIAQMNDVRPDATTSDQVMRMYYSLKELLRCCKSGKKLELAYEIHDQLSASESEDVIRIKKATIDLAVSLQRPPSMKELRDRIKWGQRGKKEFRRALKSAGLSWLPTAFQVNQTRSLGVGVR